MKRVSLRDLEKSIFPSCGAELGARGEGRESRRRRDEREKYLPHRRHRSQHWGEPLLRVRHAAFRQGRAGKKALINEGSIAKKLFRLAFDQIS